MRISSEQDPLGLTPPPSLPSPPPPPPSLPPFSSFSSDPLAQFEVEKREHEMKMRKMEQEMEEVFEMKVQEKLQKLKDIEADVSTERVNNAALS